MTWRHGASQLTAKEGSAVEGKTNCLQMAQCEDMLLNLFQELRSMIICLILLGIWWCSHGLVYNVLQGPLWGLSEVCENVLKPCLRLPGCLFPTGDSRKGLLPLLALPLLESFEDQLIFGFVFFPPAFTKIRTHDSLGIWSDSLCSRDHKEYLQACQNDLIACAPAPSVYGCKRADKPHKERWGWYCWGKLSVWVAFDAVHL